MSRTKHQGNSKLSTTAITYVAHIQAALGCLSCREWNLIRTDTRGNHYRTIKSTSQCQATGLLHNTFTGSIQMERKTTDESKYQIGFWTKKITKQYIRGKVDIWVFHDRQIWQKIWQTICQTKIFWKNKFSKKLPPVGFDLPTASTALKSDALTN